MTLSYIRIRYEITLIYRYIFITIVAYTSLPVGLSSLQGKSAPWIIHVFICDMVLSKMCYRFFFFQAFNNKKWSMLIITLNKAYMNKYDYTMDDSLLKIIYLTALRPIPGHTYFVFRTYTLQ